MSKSIALERVGGTVGCLQRARKNEIQCLQLVRLPTESVADGCKLIKHTLNQPKYIKD